MAKKTSDPIPQSITWESVRRELNSARTDQGQIDYDKVRLLALRWRVGYGRMASTCYWNWWGTRAAGAWGRSSRDARRCKCRTWGIRTRRG